jgi:F-type H+-transporting ATPase subunit delta
MMQLAERIAARVNQKVEPIFLEPTHAIRRPEISAALSKITGKNVRINVAIDPAVLGGISVTIGEDVIDGSIAARLESARRSLLA